MLRPYQPIRVKPQTALAVRQASLYLDEPYMQTLTAAIQYWMDHGMPSDGIAFTDAPVPNQQCRSVYAMHDLWTACRERTRGCIHADTAVWLAIHHFRIALARASALSDPGASLHSIRRFADDGEKTHRAGKSSVGWTRRARVDGRPSLSSGVPP